MCGSDRAVCYLVLYCETSNCAGQRYFLPSAYAAPNMMAPESFLSYSKTEQLRIKELLILE